MPIRVKKGGVFATFRATCKFLWDFDGVDAFGACDSVDHQHFLARNPLSDSVNDHHMVFGGPLAKINIANVTRAHG